MFVTTLLSCRLLERIAIAKLQAIAFFGIATCSTRATVQSLSIVPPAATIARYLTSGSL
jgi:hypothetical protein